MRFVNNLHGVEKFFTTSNLKALFATALQILKGCYCVAGKPSMVKCSCLAKICKIASFIPLKHLDIYRDLLLFCVLEESILVPRCLLQEKYYDRNFCNSIKIIEVLHADTKYKHTV